MDDRLSSLLTRFELRARVCHGDGMRGAKNFTVSDNGCHLHLVRGGSLVVTGAALGRHVIAKPSAVILSRPVAYRLDSDDHDLPGVVSAVIEFGSGDENPILRSLPTPLVIPLACVPSLDAIQQVLFVEAHERACGHDAVVGRLTEVLVIQLLRSAMRGQLVERGSLAGLSDPRLGKTLTAVHLNPADNWTLESMASIAGMSRSRFAASFTDIVGIAPGEYVAQWRIGLAKSLLRRGRAVKEVALEVGYGSASALTRAFARNVGLTPTQWFARQRESRHHVVP
jgi:AraC-like DNA-binding protein